MDKARKLFGSSSSSGKSQRPSDNQIEQLQEKLKESSEKLKISEELNFKYYSEVEYYKRQSEKQGDLIKELINEKQNLKNWLDRAKSELNEQALKIKDLTLEKNNLKDDLEKEHSKVSEQEKMIGNLKIENYDLNSKLTQAGSELLKLRQVNNEYTILFSILKSHLIQMKYASNNFKNQIKAIIHGIQVEQIDSVMTELNLEVPFSELKNYIPEIINNFQINLIELQYSYIQDYRSSPSQATEIILSQCDEKSIINPLNSIINDYKLIPELILGKLLQDRDEIDNLQKSAENYQKNNISLSKTLKEKQVEIETLKKNNQEIEREVETKQKKIEILTEDIEKNITRLNYESRIKSLEEEVRYAKNVMLKFQMSEKIQENKADNSLDVQEVKRLIEQTRSELIEPLKILAFA